ncbi:MAG: hypothetical protein IJ782_00775 [Prevotella sp.]|nr:hypothetical protein [Prevotella sp.]
MRQLTNLQSIIFALGALLMVAGVGCVVFGVAHPWLQKSGALAFALGALCFAGMQLTQVYTGTNFTIRRLRRIMIFADVCFILAALLLVEHTFQILFPLFATSIDGYNSYIHYIYNNWVVALLVAALLEMYSMHRIAYELRKEQEKA